MRVLDLVRDDLRGGEATLAVDGQQRGSEAYIGFGVGSFSYEEEVVPDVYTFEESASSCSLARWSSGSPSTQKRSMTSSPTKAAFEEPTSAWCL